MLNNTTSPKMVLPFWGASINRSLIIRSHCHGQNSSLNSNASVSIDLGGVLLISPFFLVCLVFTIVVGHSSNMSVSTAGAWERKKNSSASSPLSIRKLGAPASTYATGEERHVVCLEILSISNLEAQLVTCSNNSMVNWSNRIPVQQPKP